MLRSLRTAALGMAAQQLNIDTIANNLANINTSGFKKSNVEFQDLLYETIQSGAIESDGSGRKPAEIQIGLGNKPVSTYKSFSQGNIVETGNPLDVAINGRGFLQVQRNDGSYAYTRDGALRIDSNGNLVTPSGMLLAPDISLPEGVNSVSISQSGVLSVLIAGDSTPQEIGQLEMAIFMNPAGLRSIGGNLYEETGASGPATTGLPNEDGFGPVVQGYLEKSNVDVVQEMINLIVAQRSYEINSKAVKTADELMALTNQMKR